MRAISKTLTIGAAIGALMTSGALAQVPNSPSRSSSTPPAAMQTQPSSDKADFVSTQQSDQWLATKFTGTDVLGIDNQKIGDVSDILFDKTGNIQAYVISVGGFLGMGAKEVALAPTSFDVVPGQNGDAPKLRLSMSKEQLTQAHSFARYEAQTTTGSGLPRPSGSGMAPAGGSKTPNGSK